MAAAPQSSILHRKSLPILTLRVLMRHLGLSALAASLALFLPACSGGGSDSSSSGGTSDMYILTCSLGCPSGVGGQEVQCTPLSIALNQEISITFSQPVQASSINTETFRLINTLTGAVPIGTRLVDPANPRRVIFRPSLSFDTTGNPIYGFQPGASYSIEVPGTGQDLTGPYIKGTNGKQNQSRLSCQISTTSSAVDYVPGAPSCSVFVDVFNTTTNAVVPNQPANGATNVWRNSTIRFEFNDVMNPVTLASSLTQQATSATVKVDLDGNLATTSDQATLAGSYIVTLDLANLKTIMTFTATGGMPSAGDPLINPQPRKVVVTFPNAMQDLAGNGLANPGQVAFVPEVLPQSPVALPDADGEQFDNAALQQTDISAATWGSGRLTRGYGGGSGRLGRLVVSTGTTLTLSTTSQVFPLAGQERSLLDNSDITSYTPADPATWPTITVTNGQFEFTSLTVEPGASLAFTGVNPARVLVRGPVDIQGGGLIDISGADGAVHGSANTLGGVGGQGGPNAGSGGNGATRFDNGGLTSLLNFTSPSSPYTCGIDIPGTAPSTGNDYNGQAGGGIGGIGGGFGAAPGALVHPGSNFPNSNVAPASTNTGLAWTATLDSGCAVQQPGRAGGGGSFSLLGQAGVSDTPDLVNEQSVSNVPTNSLPGSQYPLEPADPQSGHVKRKLDADLGYLVGGSGGAGGGGSLFGTKSSNFTSPCGGGNAVMTDYWDHSGAGGGGGGGAFQLVSGTRITLSGSIDAAGGRGGSGDPANITIPAPPTVSPDRAKFAAPGGGGSGGAVRLQAPAIDFAQLAGRVDISGGAGGITDFNVLPGASVDNATGGAGSPGLIRVEDGPPATFTRALIAPLVAPFNSILDPESKDYVSVGAWVLPRKRPESFTASVSCWLQPQGNFFLLRFNPDDLANPDPAQRYGWNMDVIYTTKGGDLLVKYRGPDANFPISGFDDFEEAIGNQLNHGLAAGQGSYFAVRFQGAKSLTNISNQPCDVVLNGVGQEIQTGSLTPWVKHPSDLNQFSPRPNMIRFCIVFDMALVTPGSTPSLIKGVTNLKINALPD